MADAVRIDRIRMLKEQATNPDRRDKINRILSDLGKFAVDSAVNDSLKAVNGWSLLSLSLSLVITFICDCFLNFKYYFLNKVWIWFVQFSAPIV